MKHASLTIHEAHNEDFYETIRHHIIAFNAPHFYSNQRHPLGFAHYNDNGILVGGVAGKTFGKWFLLEYLWVDASSRGRGVGQQLLARAEQEACTRGCQFVLLDTLDFQAQPFYAKLGYQTQWEQTEYPSHGRKFFMTKTLSAKP